LGVGLPEESFLILEVRQLGAGSGRFSGSWVYNNKWYAVHVRHQGKDIKTNMGRGPALWSTEVE
jgi:uncharacterized membrane protein YbaN (DUF454 family)